MKIIYITNDDAFKGIGSPKLNYSEIGDMRYPTNLVFGKTYYTEKDGRVVAFKVLAMAIVNSDWQRTHCVKFHKDFIVRMAYFVQYANMAKPIWELNTLDYPCFESVEDYMLHSTTNMHTMVEWGNEMLGYLLNDRNEVVYKTYNCTRNTIHFRKTYVWDKCNNAPHLDTSLIESIVFTNEGMIVCYNPKLNTLNKPINGFSTFEECANNHLNNMEIVDFEETTFNLNIEIKVATPKSHIIQVMELEK
jgi:hypothetical protein